MKIGSTNEGTASDGQSSREISSSRSPHGRSAKILVPPRTFLVNSVLTVEIFNTWQRQGNLFDDLVYFSDVCGPSSLFSLMCGVIESILSVSSKCTALG